MKHLCVTVRPDPDLAPEFFHLLADSPHTDETRLVDWNLGPDEAATLLYAVDGDAAAFRESATETPGIDAVEVSRTGTDRFHALVRARPGAIPLVRHAIGALSRAGLVVVTPVVYRDARIEGNIVGDPPVLQATLADLPDAIDVTIREIRSFRGVPETPEAVLSDRQLEAVVAALELGYYDQPRRATHEDVAAELDCAPSTATHHLQRAEAKLIRASLRRVRSTTESE